MKEGCLFVFFSFLFFVLMKSTEPRCFKIMFLVSSKSSQGGKVHQLGSMTFGLAMQKFLNIE
jgi:hypothetical protein